MSSDPTPAEASDDRGVWAPTTEHFLALFEPRGVVVAGASTHPGKFGFVALHNILASGYPGRVFPTNREGAEILGLRSLTGIDDVPDGEADLVFVCTPAASNADLLRSRPPRASAAAFIASAGYGEAGEAGIRRPAGPGRPRRATSTSCSWDRTGRAWCPLLRSCAPRSSLPYPPRGRIGIVSQSGNFVSSFQNYARFAGVGISRAVSAGNAAQVGVVDFLEFFADDPETDVALAYVEGVADGRRFYQRIRSVCERIPVVLVKGGATAGGARAAASHTGSLATDDRVFDGMCRQAGVTRARTIEEAYDLAAAFATQPLPTGRKVAVVSTVGGWGVVTADAIAGCATSTCPPPRCPPTFVAALDGELPAVEPQQPHRPRRWRDEGHGPRGDRPRRPPRGHRRGGAPRDGHPGEQGEDGA